MSREAAANGSREAQEEEMCSICLGPLVNRVCIIPCRHTFCRDCIEPWAAERVNCPLCRSVIVNIVPQLPVNAAARRPRGRLQRRRRRRERRRSARRSRRNSARRRRRRFSRPPLQTVYHLIWQWELSGPIRLQLWWDIEYTE